MSELSEQASKSHESKSVHLCLSELSNGAC